MANYYSDAYNRFIGNAKTILSYLSGAYMDTYNGRELICDGIDDIIPGMKFIEISRFRKLSSDQTSFDTWKAAIRGQLAMYHSDGFAVAYFIVSDGDMLHLYIASEDEGNHGFDSGLNGFMPELKCQNRFTDINDLARMAKYGGIVTGAFDVDHAIIDSVMDAMNHQRCVCGIIAIPVSRTDGEKYRSALLNMQSFASSFDAVDRTFGNNTNLRVHNRFPDVEQLLNYLKTQTERMEGQGNALWKTSVWFAAEEHDQAMRLGATLSGVLSSSNKEKNVRSNYFFLTDTIFSLKKLGLTELDFSDFDYPIDDALMKGSLYSYQTTNELAGLFQFPMRSHLGIEVVDRNVSSDSAYSFTMNVPRVDGRSFIIGKEVSQGQDYRIPLDGLTEHMLVTGASGGGKSNTMWNIVEELDRNKIPFCILEPEKKEYWHLRSTVRSLKVYSPDYDALPLIMNPLEPEEGIVISNHISDFVYAVSSNLEMDEATKESFAGLLRYTYEKFGWNENDIAYSKPGREYPFISDLIDNLFVYSEKEIRSGAEVKMNIEGAVYRRLNEISSGVTGRITNRCENGTKQITGRELCTGNVLIELDGIELAVKSFVTAMLLSKIRQYIRRLDSSKTLKNVIIIEEAHNIMPPITTDGRLSSKSLSSEYISSMLSAIRDYGTGVIIVDQGASKINSNAVANTKYEIAHGLGLAEDASIVSFALGMNEYQRQFLGELKTGEAFIAVRGQVGANRVRINKARTNKDVSNFGCIFCSHSGICMESNISEICEANIERASLVLSQVASNGYEVGTWYGYLVRYLDSLNISKCERVCALGYFLAHSKDNTNIGGERIRREIMYAFANKDRSF